MTDFSGDLQQGAPCCCPGRQQLKLGPARASAGPPADTELHTRMPAVDAASGVVTEPPDDTEAMSVLSAGAAELMGDCMSDTGEPDWCEASTSFSYSNTCGTDRSNGHHYTAAVRLGVCACARLGDWRQSTDTGDCLSYCTTDVTRAALLPLLHT